MTISFIKRLCESEIQNTELALATESFSDEIQGIIEKVTNLKTKELAELVKKIRYDGNIEKADQFNQELGAKLDTLISTATEVKNDIDNNVVQLFKGEDLSQDGTSEDEGLNDLGSDFGGEGEEGDDFNEFSADENVGDEDVDLNDLDFAEVKREPK